MKHIPLYISAQTLSSGYDFNELRGKVHPTAVPVSQSCFGELTTVEFDDLSGSLLAALIRRDKAGRNRFLTATRGRPRLAEAESYAS